MKKLITLASAAVLSLPLVGCASKAASTGEFPSRDVTIIVPFAAGGPTDNMARTIGAHLEKELGKQVLVVNREGATGAIAMQAMLAERPDGHTLSVFASTSGPINPLQLDVNYDNDDYRPVAGIIQNPAVIAVGEDSALKDSKSFFEHARKNPGDVKVAVVGATSSQAMELTRMSEEYDVTLKSVPFNGSAEAITALLGGNVDAIFIPAAAEVVANVESGKFRPVAVSTAERVDYLPDTPSLVELGFDQLDDSVATFGLVAPDDTPDEVVDELETAVEAALRDEEVVKTLDPRFVPDEFVDGEEFQALIDASIEAYGPLVEK